LLEEIPHLSALSELGKKELDKRVRGAEMKSKTSKNDLLGDSCQD
jgi:hypothetical protein